MSEIGPTEAVNGERKTEENKEWFVLRDLKRPNSLTPAWRELTEAGHEIFTPMREYIVTRGGKKIRINKPVINDLLFLHTDREAADKIVASIPTLQYRFAKGGGYRQPMTVRPKEMDRFIRAVKESEEPKYILPAELDESALGSKVRIIGGPLEGVEGTLLRIRGARKRRIVVSIPELLSVEVEVTPDFVEVL